MLKRVWATKLLSSSSPADSVPRSSRQAVSKRFQKLAPCKTNMQSLLHLWIQNLKGYHPNKSKPGLFNARTRQGESRGHSILCHPRYSQPNENTLHISAEQCLLPGEVKEINQGCCQQALTGEGGRCEKSKVRARNILGELEQAPAHLEPGVEERGGRAEQGVGPAGQASHAHSHSSQFM